MAIPFGISYLASRWLMEQFGFEAFGTGDLSDWLLIATVVIVIGLYLWMKFARLGQQPGAADARNWRHSEALFRSVRSLAILAMLLYAVATGIGFGRWEAERLISGSSPRSTLVTFTNGADVLSVVMQHPEGIEP